ncbi:hypothetical protein V6N13_090436 [Hibiscus sabdariffa]
MDTTTILDSLKTIETTERLDEVKDIGTQEKMSKKVDETYSMNTNDLSNDRESLSEEVLDFRSLRRKLLCLSANRAALPEDVKKELEDPQSRYNVGWSHGEEQLESGKPDLLKGSFYANPLLDVSTKEASWIQRYASYCKANILPQAALPELEVAFQALGNVIFDVGLLVAYH